MAPLVAEAAVRYAERLTVVTLNVEVNPAVPTRFGIRGFPTFMIFKDGRPADIRIGALSRPQLQAFIEAHI